VRVIFLKDKKIWNGIKGKVPAFPEEKNAGARLCPGEIIKM
jgi:hypothetical protein